MVHVKFCECLMYRSTIWSYFWLCVRNIFVLLGSKSGTKWLKQAVLIKSLTFAFISETKRSFPLELPPQPKFWIYAEIISGFYTTMFSYKWELPICKGFIVLIAGLSRSNPELFIDWPIWSSWICQKMPCERYLVRHGNIPKRLWDSICQGTLSN